METFHNFSSVLDTTSSEMFVGKYLLVFLFLITYIKKVREEKSLDLIRR